VGGITISQYQVQDLTNNTLYYWRVNATNNVGTGPWSIVWHFTTIVSAPIAPPQLISPPNGATGISSTPTLNWNNVYGATDYQIQLSTDSAFNPNLIDSSTINSQITIPDGRLTSNTRYYWHVRAHNIGGYGPWSQIWHFTTGVIGILQLGSEIPKEFKLYYNYPNPFNPSTKIKFDVPAKLHAKSQITHAKLTVYDLLGRIVSIIYDGDLLPGAYEVSWNASTLASGIYLYRLTTDENIAVKKMVLIK
jgi:hypothetical protein